MRRFRFRPGRPDLLESRIALTHGGPVTPALIGTLSPNPRASGPPGRVAAQINGSFDRFERDYLQAQGAFLSSSAPPSTLKQFTRQRIGLLSQELVRTMSRLPGSLQRIGNLHQRSVRGNSDTVLQGFLYTRIDGPVDSTNSLLATLNADGLVPNPKPDAASATLYTLTATNAIETARAATINAIKSLIGGSFKNG